MSLAALLPSRADCEALDHADPLAHLRQNFCLPDGIVYLDGNSLGALPRAAPERVQQVVAQEWGTHLIGSWNQAGWFGMPLRLGDLLAPLIGAGPGEVAVTDSTSVNLFKVLAAALQMQSATPRRTIVSERANFPSDLYIAEALTSWLARGYRLKLVDTAHELMAAIDDDTAVLMLTHVNYRSGALHDMQALTAHAHDNGALAIWDLAHSAGALEIDLGGANADFAVGCCYKYFNGGPGAPAFLWVPTRHQERFSQPLSGWWAHVAPFAMQDSFIPGDGIRRALCGTQPIVSLALVECGLAIFSQTSMAAVRCKSLALSDLFIRLTDCFSTQHGITLATPRAHARRGSHVSLAHAHGHALMCALIVRGVIGDYRAPDLMRFGFTPLYTRYVDVWDAAASLREILEDGTYAVKGNFLPSTEVT